MPSPNRAASSKAFEAFLRMFRNHRAEGLDVPLATYVAHFKAAESWIRASWDELDAVQPATKSLLTPVNIPPAAEQSDAAVDEHPTTRDAAPAAEDLPTAVLPVESNAASLIACSPLSRGDSIYPLRTRTWPWIVAGAGALIVVILLADPFDIVWNEKRPGDPPAPTDAAREQAATIARNLELEAATRRSSVERDAARAERDDAVSTLDQARRELSNTKDSLITSEGRRLLVEARRRAKSDPTLGLLIAIEGAQRAPGAMADAVLRETLIMMRERQSVVAAPTGAHAIAWRLDQRAILASAVTGGNLWTPDGTAWKRQAIDGPTSGFLTAAWSLDGSRMALGASDGVARVYDATGQLLVELKDHPCDVTSIALSPNGSLALTGGSDGCARIFEVPSGRMVRTFEMMDPIDVVTFDRRGIHIAVVTRGDRRTRFFAVATGRPEGSVLGELLGGSEGFSPEGDRVLIRVNGGSLAYVRWIGSEGLATDPILNGLSAAAGAISPDGSLLVVVGTDRMVRILDAESKTMRACFMGPPTAPTSVAFTADNLGLLFTARDGIARHWSIRPVMDSGRLTSIEGLRCVIGLKDPLALSSDGTRVALSTLRLNDMPRFINLDAPPSVMTLSGDGATLIATDSSGVSWIDTGQGSKLARVQSPMPGHVSVVASQSGQHVGLVTDSGRVFTSVSRGEFKDIGWDGPVAAIAIDPNGEHLLIGGRDRPAVVIDVATNRRLATLGGTQRGVTALATRGRVTVAATSDGTISMHETSSGRTTATAETLGDVKFLVLDSDATTVSVVTTQGAWILVDVATGEKRLDAVCGIPHARPLFLLDGTPALTSSDGSCLRVGGDALTEALARKPRSLSTAERARLGIPAAAR